MFKHSKCTGRKASDLTQNASADNRLARVGDAS
jgi:hypothetical protein